MSIVRDELSLFSISKLAKTEPASAEQLLLAFVQGAFPQIRAQSVKVNRSKVSLNSVNGIIQAPDTEYFFKFHTEEGDEQTVSEYYNANVLADAGLPVIRPLFQETVPGRQFLIYEKITAPTAFDLFEREDERYDNADALLNAERALVTKQTEVFLNTLAVVPAEEQSHASLYQLFYTRLTSTEKAKARLDLFYTGQVVSLPNGEQIPLNEFSKLRWTINGVRYEESLVEIITAAKDLLNPMKEGKVPVVLGHGDCHAGNRFFIDGRFSLFDPAFAGLQPALLSFVKATAHNVFCHPLWLYDPAKLTASLDIRYRIEGDTIIVDHNWDFADRSPFRLELLALYRDSVWRPLIAELRKQNILVSYWRDYLHKALFCCPFLVLNLIDNARFAPPQSLLALSKCIELGSKSSQRTTVNTFLDSLI